jgi:anti-sigma factor RsiW
MARIIPLPVNRHQDVQALLPWYVMNRLDPADRAKVEAHLAECSECRADADLERRLDAEVAGLSLDTELGWARMRRRIAAGDPRRIGWKRRGALIGRALRRPRVLGWALAAQVALVLCASALLLSEARPARYLALGEPRPARHGDAILQFRPQASEAQLRRALRAEGARIVDGPTSADAYVVQIPSPFRDAALARLRRDPNVLLAEPIDTDDAP